MEPVLAPYAEYVAEPVMNAYPYNWGGYVAEEEFVVEEPIVPFASYPVGGYVAEEFIVPTSYN